MAGTQGLHFIGVTTGGSRIMRLFPAWAEELGLDAELRGHDVELGADAGTYRRVVEEIAGDASARGALVTTHKVDVYRHARDLFAGFDDYAELIGEVSCISKRDGGALVGHAKDPVTAAQALDAMLPGDYWRAHPDAHVLCLGAGGAGTAIIVALAEGSDRPPRIVATDRDPERLQELRRVHAALPGPQPALGCQAAGGPDDHDRLLSSMPAGSLIVNATGMGKDLPGSPISERARFPDRAVVWELNYRGERRFLQQAGAQAVPRSLQIHDGWRYFLHGWTEVIAEVFRLDLGGDRFDRLAEVAEGYRPS